MTRKDGRALVQREHPLQSMSSYLGGFPPRVPRTILERFVGTRSVVLDPFCGAGTTLVEAIRRGNACIGVDLNPLAVALSRAKTQRIDLEHVLHRIDELVWEFPGEVALDGDQGDDIRVIYHPRTLSQLCYLRGALDPARPEDALLVGAILGIMHGKHRRDGGSSYLSIDMPNTFSMSPAYVRKFVQENGLVKRPIDVFHQLRARCRWLFRSGTLPAHPSAKVVLGDATQLPNVLQDIGVKNVGAIVTSPPYLGVLRYGTFNWIRLWFLGYTQSEVDRSLDGTGSMDVYLSFMATFLDAAARVTSPGATVALVIGDVVEHGQHVRLAERVWEELGQIVPFDLTALEVDDYDNGAKTTRIWGEARKGRATPTDRVLVLTRRSRLAFGQANSRKISASARRIEGSGKRTSSAKSERMSPRRTLRGAR